MSARHRIADPTLPLLDTLLEPAAAHALIEAHLPEFGGELELRSLGIADVRYDPGARAQVLYRLKTQHRESGRNDRPLLTVRLLAREDSPIAAPPDPHAVPDGASAALRTRHLWVPEHRLELVAYPFDPELPSLAAALSGDAVAAGLDELWRDRGTVVRRVHVAPLGYTPGNRAAFGYEVLAEDRKSHVPELRNLIGKLHAKKPADRLFAGSWALWRALEGRCRLAPPIGYLPALAMTLQERVRGERLGALADHPSFARRVRQTARALAALHAVDIPLATRRKPDEEARVVHRWSSVLMGIRPDLAPRIERLRDELAAALEAAVRLEGPVHADFHHTNVMVDDDGITIIDLDEMAFGDPLLDVGRFLASLRIPSLRAFGNVDALRDARELFLQEYLRLRPADERRVRLFEAACLFTAAASAFRIQRAAWPAEVELLVDEAARAFERAPRPRQRAPRPPGEFPVVSSPERWARDPVYMATMLREPVLQAYGIEPRELRIRTRGDDALAWYEVKGRRQGEKAAVTLAGMQLSGGGAALLRRLELLRAALPDAADAPRLPRPVTYLRALGLTVLELPTGEKLTSLLDGPAADDAIERLARALAVLHRTPVALDRVREPAEDVRLLERRVSRLRESQPALHELAVRVLDAVRSRELPATLAPALGTIRPNQVVLDDARVGFAHVETLVLGSPLLDLGDVLARLALRAFTSGQSQNGARERFRGVYDAHLAVPPEEAATLEAAALLRLACNQANAADPRVPEFLLRRAAALLEVA